MDSFLSGIGFVGTDVVVVLVRVVLAAFCGGMLGIERTRKRRAAGVRTYMLISVGAAVVMITGEYLTNTYNLSDPARLGAQVISGIGFIGAGTIIMTGYHEVKGITTAAGLWASACIGLAIGAGFYLIAIIATGLLLVIMIFGGKLQFRYMLRSKRLRIFVLFENLEYLPDFLIEARKNGIIIHDCEHLNKSSDVNIGSMFSVELTKNITHKQVIELLGKTNGVKYIEELN
ncbi:MAG: MgtC/SapB family protein [Eubacteriales bacterium]